MRCNRLLGSSLFLFLNIGMIKIKLTCLRPLDIVAKTHHILLMEEILHYLGCIILVNNGMNYQPQLVNAGFQPSTVWKAGCIIWVFFKDGKPPTQDAGSSAPGLSHPPKTNSKFAPEKWMLGIRLFPFGVLAYVSGANLLLVSGSVYV